MSAFNRQLSAAQRQYDNAYPYDDAEEAREEAVEARADDLFDQYAKDDRKVLEAVEGVNTLGFDGLLDRAVRDFLMDWNRAGDDDATAIRDLAQRLHERIWPHIEAELMSDARMDAEYERQCWEVEQAEMRNGGLGDAA